MALEARPWSGSDHQHGCLATAQALCFVVGALTRAVKVPPAGLLVPARSFGWDQTLGLGEPAVGCRDHPPAGEGLVEGAREGSRSSPTEGEGHPSR